MGKRLIQQRRGRNKGHFKVPSHRFRGKVKYIRNRNNHQGIVEDIIHDPGRTAPLASVRLEDNSKILIIAPEGVLVGDSIKFTQDKKEITKGSILPIGKVSEGTPVCNIELSPGDGGKLARAGGNNATIVSHNGNETVIQLPSKQFKTLQSSCRATVGIIAGGGRNDKPFLKAGKKYHASRARGKQYPVVRGVAMCAVSHPHGGGGHQHVGKPYTVGRGASPGRKVGSIAARRTGGK